MRSLAISVFVAICILRPALTNVADTKIRSDYIRNNADDGNRRMFSTDEINQRSYGPNDWRSDRPDEYYQPSRKSYFIYDGNTRTFPYAAERPQIMDTTRPWHLEFNQKRNSQSSQSNLPSSVPLAYHSVYSNLIQVYDEPPLKKYYGPYSGKGYLEPERHYYYPRPKPSEVPKYDVIYPYESHQSNHHYSGKLPDKFPSPFLPEKSFEFKDPLPPSGPRKEIGFYNTQTVHYPIQDATDDRRGVRTERCNYIRLNDKGFPVGNEMCGRTVSDILLAPDYPNTGELIMEHRKRYRYQDRTFERSQSVRGGRRRRSAEDMSARFGGGVSSYYSRGGCCGEAGGNGYGYRPFYGYPNNRQELEYDNERFVSRPYGSERGSYDGHGYGGQNYGNNGNDGVGEETSDNRGLTSYLTGRGQGDRGRFKDSEENRDSDEERENRGSSNSNSYGSGSRTDDSRVNDRNNSQGRKSNSNSRNNHRNQSSNRNSNSSDRAGNSDSRSQGNNRSSNNWRNSWSGGDSEEGNSGGSSNDGFYGNGRGSNYDGYSRNNGGTGGYNNGYYGNSGSYGGNSYNMGSRRGFSNLGGYGSGSRDYSSQSSYGRGGYGTFGNGGFDNLGGSNYGRTFSSYYGG